MRLRRREGSLVMFADTHGLNDLIAHTPDLGQHLFREIHRTRKRADIQFLTCHLLSGTKQSHQQDCRLHFGLVSCVLKEVSASASI